MRDAERHHRYYYFVADKNRKRSRWVNAGLMGISLLAATTLLLDLSDLVPDALSKHVPDAVPALITVVLFYLVTALTMFEMFVQTARVAGVAETVSRQCNDVATEAKWLWRRIGTTDDTAEYMRIADTLERRLASVTRVGLDYDKTLDEECRDEADEVLDEEFDRSGDQDRASQTVETIPQP